MFEKQVEYEICFTYNTSFNFQIHLGEKPISDFINFYETVVRTLQRLEDDFFDTWSVSRRVYPLVKLPQLARNRAPRWPLGEIHLHPHS